MAGQEHGNAAAGVVLAQALLDGHLGDDVEANGRLIQQEKLRLVQQGGNQFHLHALAQRQFADGLTGEMFDAEQFGQLAEGTTELVGRQRVDFAMELEAVGGGQIPPQLVLLAHDQREAAAEGVGPLPGHKAQYAALPLVG